MFQSFVRSIVGCCVYVFSFRFESACIYSIFIELVFKVKVTSFCPFARINKLPRLHSGILSSATNSIRLNAS